MFAGNGSPKKLIIVKKSRKTGQIKKIYGKSFLLYVMSCSICYHLYNLKNVKAPMEECYF